ncbi:MAG: hypothetical protein ACYDBJ_18135 [Aggregatilineales bacterium]
MYRAEHADGTDLHRRLATYTWDARDRLIGASLPGGQSMSFAYDDGGHRIQQNASGQVTNYLWAMWYRRRMAAARLSPATSRWGANC